MQIKLDSIIQKASWKKAVLFTALFAIVYILINFSGIGVSGLLKITGGANILDFEFGYTNEKAYHMLTALGTEGRAFYLTKIMPVDFLFPLSYMLFYAELIALIIKCANHKNWYKYFLFLPVLAMLFDWLENVGVIAMLGSYPNLPKWAAFMASCAGILKIIFTASNIATIGILLIMSAIKCVRK